MYTFIMNSIDSSLANRRHIEHSHIAYCIVIDGGFMESFSFYKAAESPRPFLSLRRDTMCDWEPFKESKHHGDVDTSVKK